MSYIHCPHCKFQNFAISAYCGRCERPLQNNRPELTQTTANHLAIRPPPAMVSESEVTTTHIAPPSLVNQSLPATKPLVQEQPQSQPIRLRPSQGSIIPPKPAAITTEDAMIAVALPSGWRILLAWLVDLSLIGLVGAVFTILEAILLTGALPSWHNVFAPSVTEDSAYLLNSALIHGSGVAILCACLYSSFAIKQKGYTLGQKLAGTVLLRESGKPLTWPILGIRTLVSLFSTGLFGAGYFWSIVDGKHRTWHDLFSGTVIVLRPNSNRFTRRV